MAAKRYLLGVFDDERVLLKAVKGVRASGARIHDVYTPFPVHGLDDAMGLRHTRLHTAGFLFGATGVLLMFLYITWINTVNYPIIVGGKPYFALPAYVPVLFEVTVLCASVGMVIVYFVRNGLTPIRQEPVLDPRITDDKFVMAFDANKLTDDEMGKLKGLLEQEGAIEVNEKEID
jgi:hypothetical protein